MLDLVARAQPTGLDSTDAATADGLVLVIAHHHEHTRRRLEDLRRREHRRVRVPRERLRPHREVLGEEVVRDRVVDGERRDRRHALERSRRVKAGRPTGVPRAADTMEP